MSQENDRTGYQSIVRGTQGRGTGWATVGDAVANVSSGSVATSATQDQRAHAVAASQLDLHREPWEFKATAYHEAGHAVLMAYFGLGFSDVTIAPDAERDSDGHITHPSPLGYEGCDGKRERRAVARQLILMAYAGVAAERLIQPDAPDYHGASDEENAFQLSRTYGVQPRHLSFVGDAQHWEFLGRLQNEARGLVLRLRAPIAKLADELLSRTTLTWAEVEAVVGPMIPMR
ncbi:MAG: hypothetical protein ACLP66_20765 [Polyangia bacterium]|jgi:ATP-dependent Zn protease